MAGESFRWLLWHFFASNLFLRYPRYGFFFFFNFLNKFCSFLLAIFKEARVYSICWSNGLQVLIIRINKFLKVFVKQVTTKFWFRSRKITASNSLMNQRQNINQNVSETLDSDLNNLKVFWVENDFNYIVA